jgi:hypothetical protein
MRSTTASETIRNTSDLWQQAISSTASLAEQSTQLALEFLNSLAGSASSQIGNLSMGNLSMSNLASMMKMPSMQSCCNIPTPCWMPRSAGHVISHVCAGSPASAWIRVTNCGHTTRTITFDDAAKQLVTFSPVSLTLGPMESGEVKATFTPTTTASDCKDGEQSAIVWIHGCKEYYLRWTIKNVRRGVTCSCHEIHIEDCPDYLHHWYDHFYCPRPCATQGQKV